MTFSSNRLRTNPVAASGKNILIPSGTFIDENIEVDVMFIQDYYHWPGSYTKADIRNVLETVARDVRNAWPNSRFGFCYFSDFPIDPYGWEYDLPYVEKYDLDAYSLNDIANWDITYGNSIANGGLGGRDLKSSALDAIKNCAESTTIGWRPIQSNRKRIIILNTFQNPPHDSSLEPGAPHTTMTLSMQACINNDIWPIYAMQYNSDNFKLSYGSNVTTYKTVYSKYDTENQRNARVLAAIYAGTVK